MSSQLAKLFTTIAREGFCSPKEKDQTSQGEDSKLEAGTGLGDGEGAEDISKDVGDDEDLDELAQENTGEKNDKEIEDEKDAVDMADADMEGEMGEAGEQEEKDNENGEEEDEAEDIEEETGSVDDLGENTVDEKMWDEGGNMDSEKDQTADKADGRKDEDSAAAAEEQKDSKDTKNDAEKQESKEEGEGEGEEEEEEVGADEDENSGPQEAERADPTMQEQENLDLPDDIDLEGKEDMEDDDVDFDDEKDGKEDVDETEEAPPTDNEVPSAPDELMYDVSEDEISDSEMPDEKKEAGDDAEPEDQVQDNEDVLQDNRANDQNEQDESGEAEATAQGRGLVQDQDEQQQADNNDVNHASAERPQGDKGDAPQTAPDASGLGERGETGEDDNENNEPMHAEEPSDINQSFKKLGDALEDWYRRQRNIQEAKQRENEGEAPDQADRNMRDDEFEHLPYEDVEADAQAIGAAREDEARAIDEDAGTGVQEEAERRDQFHDQEEADADNKSEDEDVNMGDDDAQRPVAEVQDRTAEETRTFIGERDQSNKVQDQEMQDLLSDEEEEEDNLSDLDDLLHNTALASITDLPQMDRNTAISTWQTHESRTHNLSLQLQEQLRLILHPTQSSKLRGDFRTGKRLNIKRIIPYIASNFKRDKIWLRRSVPSKRQYQIMLALDDSKSMSEAGVGGMAFDTLAMVTRALTTLEAGELAVLGFGKEIKVPVGFGEVMGTEKGGEMVRQLCFEQGGTDMKALLTRAKGLFEDAAVSKRGPAGEVWQLMLVIGDGVFEDAEGVRRAERLLADMGVMVVFVIVDAFGNTGEAKRGKQSIVDLQVATFKKGPDGTTNLHTRKYLETFPFRYYLIVRDVVELPGVLASALKQWFSEVAETG